MLLKEVFLLLESFSQTQVGIYVLLAATLYNHVALLQWDDLVINSSHHCLLCTFVHQIRLGQNTCMSKKNNNNSPPNLLI